jgi:hypothetical protein
LTCDFWAEFEEFFFACLPAPLLFDLFQAAFLEESTLQQAQGRLFDCASRDETASPFDYAQGQDDNFYFY